jgi:acyl transferase domain-containing protein
MRLLKESAGFGGSNVHVILESYTQPLDCRAVKKAFLSAVDEPQYTPFTFSAPSEAALTATLEAYISYLQNHAGNTRLQDLAWTLQYKRSLFLHRYAGAACTSDELLKRLETVVQGARAKRKHGLYVRAKQPSPTAPRIFGVFTGQGATWATMGKSIVSRSAFARTIIARLDTPFVRCQKRIGLVGV